MATAALPFMRRLQLFLQLQRLSLASWHLSQYIRLAEMLIYFLIYTIHIFYILYYILFYIILYTSLPDECCSCGSLTKSTSSLEHSFINCQIYKLSNLETSILSFLIAWYNTYHMHNTCILRRETVGMSSVKSRTYGGACDTSTRNTP